MSFKLSLGCENQILTRLATNSMQPTGRPLWHLQIRVLFCSNWTNSSSCFQVAQKVQNRRLLQGRRPSMLDAQIVMMHWKITDTNEDQSGFSCYLPAWCWLKCTRRDRRNLTAVGSRVVIARIDQLGSQQSLGPVFGPNFWSHEVEQRTHRAHQGNPLAPFLATGYWIWSEGAIWMWSCGVCGCLVKFQWSAICWAVHSSKIQVIYKLYKVESILDFLDEQDRVQPQCHL